MPFKDETPMNKKTPYKTGIGIHYNVYNCQSQITLLCNHNFNFKAHIHYQLFKTLQHNTL